MKQKLLLALLALFTLSGSNLYAQTWEPPTIGEDPVNGEIYKVYNVQAGKYLSMGKAWFGWETTAILNDDGVDFTLTADGENWKFYRNESQGVFTSGNNISGDAMHVDNTPGTYGITELANGYYHIHDVGGNASSTCWGYNSSFHATGVVAHADASAAGWMCDWVFLKDLDAVPVFNARLKLYNLYLKAVAEGASTDDAATVYNKANATVAELEEAYAALYNTRYEHKLAIASNNNPQDITEFILNNADFSAGNIDGWETNYVAGNQAQNIGYQGASYTNGNVTISQFIEAWRWSPALGDGYLRQTVSGLPEGKYLLECDAIAADQPGGTMPTGAYLYINAAGVDYKTTMATADGKPQHFTAQFLSPGGVDVTFGMKTESTTANWIGADNFTVKFYGIDLSPYAALLAEAVAGAQAIAEGTIPAAAYTALQNVVNANNQTWTNSSDYTAAIAAIQDATATAAALQTAFSRYSSIKSAAQAIAVNVNTTSADSEVAAATTNAAIEAAIATLRAAFLAELPNVTIPTETGYIDVTDVMVDNASVRQNTNYWTIEGEQNGSYSFGKCDYDECEFYSANFKFYQTLALTSGTWEFGVTGFHRAGNHNTNFYAGADKILIPGVESSVVNSMAEAKNYFDGGKGKVALKFLIESAGDIEIGIDNQDTQTDKWTIFRDFTLKYYGAPDYSVYETQWRDLVAEANTAKTTYPNVTGSELTDLDAAIADSPAGSNLKDTYIAKINALQTALNTYTAAAPAYDKYVAYKTETIALWGSALGVAAPTTAAEAAAAVNALNIAQYNKVATDYTFSATGLIGDFGSWTGTATVAGEAAEPKYLESEHWSGETHAYYEQASAGWGNENGWTIQYQKTCTLPAGSYVVKVAARTSGPGVTSLVSCSATTATVTLPAEGARTRGINTSGVASWSDNDTFAGYENNEVVTAVGQTGLGWQWRFLPFTLTEQTEVTMTFYAEASTQYQWMSIADGELLSTTKLAQDVAYDEANDNTIENTIIADVTMTRTIKEGYNTVVLPFTLTANQVSAAFGAGTEVYAYSDQKDDEGDVQINFNKGDGSITANVPVLVKATAASNSQTFEGVQIVASDGAVVEGDYFDFVGTYAPTPVAAGDYFIGNGALYKSENNTSMKAFRAYIHAKAQIPGAKVTLFIDNIATSISEINGIEAEPGVMYNIAGQRVNKAQKGIYIVNGKKVLVK